MRYYDVWKKKMGNHGSSISESRLNTSKELFIREFKNDPSYRRATLQKLDLTEEEIDIRVTNVERTTAQKRIVFLPDSNIEVGSYIKHNNKSYLIIECESDNVIAPYSIAKYCNQTINLKGWATPISCVCEDTAYNDKGEINLDYFSMVDGKIAIYVPVNDITNKLQQNMRFIFNHNKMMVFEIISIKNVSTPNIYKIVMKKVEYNKEKDDLVNNIAYNDDILKDDKPVVIPSDGYDVISSSGIFDLRQYGASIFTVVNDGVPDVDTWTIAVDYNGVDTSHIKIEEITSNSIKIRNSKGVNTNKIILNFVKDDVSISKEVGLVK